jgi:hypothetical protein
MKTHAIHWKSRATGTIGTGTKLFEKKEAEHVAADQFPRRLLVRVRTAPSPNR